jgi:hypothetical protein
MRRSTPFALTPLTESAPGVPGEMTFTANVGPPAAVTDANVISIQKTELPALADGTPGPEFEVGRTWQFKGRFSGSLAATASAEVTLHCYDRETDEWYAIAAMQFVGSNFLSLTKGNVKDLPAVIGTSYVGVELTGLAPANQVLHLVMHEAAQ